MAQDFTRYSVQATNSAGTVFTANSNDAVIGIRIANILTSAINYISLDFRNRIYRQIYRKRYKHTSFKCS
jgi:hypothetical protein